MKNIFVVLLLIWSISLVGCRADKPSNTNVTNANSSPTQTATPVANTNSNSNTQSTPLPEFTDAETAFTEGNKLFDANKTELAVEAYSQAVKLNPDMADAWFKLGISHALIEKQNEINSLNQEIEETPTPTPTRKGKVNNKKDAPVIRNKDSEKAFEKAVAAYKKVVKKNEKDDAAFYNLGRAYNKLGEDEDSEKALREAVKLKPDDTLYQTELGAILIKLAKYDEAIKALKKAIDLDADNSEAAELMEKAQAGKKRIDFGSTPKPIQQQQQQQQDNSPRPRTSKPSPDKTPKTDDGTDKDAAKPTALKVEPKPEKKTDKKGNN